MAVSHLAGGVPAGVARLAEVMGLRSPVYVGAQVLKRQAAVGRCKLTRQLGAWFPVPPRDLIEVAGRGFGLAGEGRVLLRRERLFEGVEVHVRRVYQNARAHANRAAQPS